MRKQIINFFVVAALCACPVLASAYEFGVVDTSQIFSKYKETQKTKETLETKKTELQKDLETSEKKMLKKSTMNMLVLQNNYKTSETAKKIKKQRLLRLNWLT